MSRYARFVLTLLAIVASIVGVLGGARIAAATPPSLAIVRPPVPHPIPIFTPNPVQPVPLRTPNLPLATASPSASPASGALSPPGPVQTTWRLVHNAPRPPYWPKLSSFLVKTGPHTMGVRQLRPLLTTHGVRVTPMSANGATIILTGDQSNYYTNDITLEYGADVYLSCQNMPTNGRYTFYVYPPNGSFANNGTYTASMRANYTNNSCNNYLNFNLSTPFGGINNGGGTTVGADPAYPGVWIVALYNGTQFITETAIIANSTIDFNTYANLGLTTPTNDFNPGSSIVVGASGLNPSHSYALGWVFTGGSGLPCEFTVPSAAKDNNNAVCFTGTTTGLQAFGGNLTQYWGPASSPSTNSAPTGTYDVELYDTTDSIMVSHQQISVEPSTVGWTLTPYNSSGATPPPGFNYGDTYATDGLLDQSVTGLTYAATNIGGANGNTIRLSISDPNGVVLTQMQSYLPGLPVLTAPPTATEAGGGFTKQVAFPLQQTYYEALGPTQTPFAPNVLTAQLYDTNTGAILGSKSFTLLGYYAQDNWSTNAILQAGTTPTTGTVVIKNTGGSNYGSWNGDAISGVTIATIPANGEVLGLSSTTAVDSAGNAWTISSSGSGVNTVITATTNQRNVGIPVGGTLQFNVTVAIPTGDCLTPCDLPTQILPEHGIAYSATDTASQALQVLSNSVSPGSVVPTEAWAVTSETATANMAARVAAYDHMAYIYGTANSPSTDYYTYNVTLDNVVSAGNHRLSEVEFTFPSAVDLNAEAANITFTPPAGTGTWALYTNSSFNANFVQPLGTAGQNVIAFACRQNTPDTCGIPVGSSGTFQINIPLFTTSFTETNITALANFDNGNAYGNCGSCADASYTLDPTQTTVNAIAGVTNVNSSEIGSYSFNPTLMSMNFQPNTVGTGAGSTSASLDFTNTPASRDPNPDYVDEVDLLFPAGTDPTSITVPSGWYSFETAAGSRHWKIALCAAPGPTNATPCSTNEVNAIPPGGQLAMTVNWSTGPAAGTYNVGWYVTGANGGVDSSALGTTTPITFSNTTASVAFTSINGASVTSGSEPQVGTDTASSGSSFVYTVDNTGSNTLTAVTVTVPHLTRSGTAGSDGATGNGGYFDITSTPTLTYTGGATGCAVAYTNPTSAADGSIRLTGCTIPKAATVAINFNAQTPYLVGNEFVFPATIYQGATPYTAQTTYTASDVLAVILNGTLTLITPAVGWVAPTQPNSIVPADGTLTPQTNCVSCQVLGTTPKTIDFGYFSGTFNATDVLDASVRSDANSPNSWVLYVTTSPGTNPSNMLQTSVDNGASRSSSHAGFTINQTTNTAVLTTTPGLQLSTYAGSPYHGPLDSVMNFAVVTGGNTSPQTVTLTYTLVFN